MSVGESVTPTYVAANTGKYPKSWLKLPRGCARPSLQPPKLANCFAHGEQGLTWLHAAPKIKLLPNHAKRQPYLLSWNEQERLFAELPDHLEEIATFAVNTGCRDSEICNLHWEWEVDVPELGTSVFIIPGRV